MIEIITTSIFYLKFKVPYTHHATIDKEIIFWKNLFENKEMVFKNGVKNIQTAAYNGARTVNNKNDMTAFTICNYFCFCQQSSKIRQNSWQGSADNTFYVRGALYTEYENTTFYLNLLDRLSLWCTKRSTYVHKGVILLQHCNISLSYAC